MFQLTMPVADALETFVTPEEGLSDSLFTDGTFQSEVNKEARTCKQYTRVRVYRNLNKPEFFSIMAMEGENKGLVCGYARSVKLENFKFVVGKKSRLRVHKEGKRNVHAFCDGIITDASNVTQDISGKRYVTYNPYLGESFFEPSTNKPITKGSYNAVLQGSGAYLQR